MKTTVAAVRGECAQLQMFIGVDWAGRPAVAEEDAAGLVSGSTRREVDQRAEWMAHLRLTEEWEAERERVRREAAQTARFDVLRRGVGEPAAQSVGHDAAAAAVEQFEKKNPAPTYGGNATARNWVCGVVDKMRSAVT